MYLTQHNTTLNDAKKMLNESEVITFLIESPFDVGDRENKRPVIKEKKDKNNVITTEPKTTISIVSVVSSELSAITKDRMAAIDRVVAIVLVSDTEILFFDKVEVTLWSNLVSEDCAQSISAASAMTITAAHIK
jgi:hypothetical protein